MRNLLITIILLLIVSACTTTRYIDREVPIETIKTEYINKIKFDSIYIHDSIDRYVSEDTVYMYKLKYIYKYLNKIDTIVKKDTIEIPVEIKTTEIKEVNKIKWYQKILIWIGSLSIISIGIIGIRKFKLNKSK